MNQLSYTWNGKKSIFVTFITVSRIWSVFLTQSSFECIFTYYTRRFCAVQPFSYNAGDECPFASYVKLAEVLAQSSLEFVVTMVLCSLYWCRSSAVLEGLTFVKSGYFVNTSRVDPKLLCVDRQLLKITGTNNLAVGIMLGIANECFIIKPGMGGSPTSPYPVRKLSLVPFTQSYRRDTSLWGKLFDFRVVSGPVSNTGFSFLSRKKDG